MMSMSLIKEGHGFRYTLREGRFVATGWARGSRRDADQEARAHLADLARADSSRDTMPSPAPIPPCPECDGTGGFWDHNPDHERVECVKCDGSGVAACDGCGEPAVTHDDSHPALPICQTCLDLCHHCGSRPHTKKLPGTTETQWCDECLAELELNEEEFAPRSCEAPLEAWGRAS